MSALKKTSSLAAGLIQTKGKAVPSLDVAMKVASVSSTPVVKNNVPIEKIDASDNRVAVTVRLNPETYRRLKMHGLENRKSNQDIFVDALNAYLRKDV